MLSFIGEKYHGKILWLTQYHGSVKLLASKHPKKHSWGLCPLTPISQGWCPQASVLGSATTEPRGLGTSVQYTWGTNKTECHL